MSVAVKNEDRESRISREFRHPDGLATQYALRVSSRVRPAPEPNDLGRRSDGCREGVKVGVGAHNDEVPRLGKLPNFAIGAFEQAELRNMSRLRV